MLLPRKFILRGHTRDDADSNKACKLIMRDGRKVPGTALAVS